MSGEAYGANGLLNTSASPRVRKIGENDRFMKGIDMREHYDFSESVMNPYAKKFK